MHRAEVEIAFRWDVGDVDGDGERFGVFPDARGGCGVVDGDEDEGDVVGGVEVEGNEGAGAAEGDLGEGEAVGDFRVKVRWGGD